MQRQQRASETILTLTVTNMFHAAIDVISQSDEELQRVIGELHRKILSGSRRVKEIKFSVLL